LQAKDEDGGMVCAHVSSPRWSGELLPLLILLACVGHRAADTSRSQALHIDQRTLPADPLPVVWFRLTEVRREAEEKGNFGS
jgi:hypothetical protein